MTRLRKVLIGGAISAALAVCLTPVLAQRVTAETHLTKSGAGIAARPAAADFERGEMVAMPRYDPRTSAPFQVDLRGWDLRKLDLRGRRRDLLRADFDDRTKWPKELPEGFAPARIEELGKSPGLGVRALHAAGITGKGVGVAVIDQGLLVDHVEYKDRLRLYEEIHSTDRQAAMHGPGVASIAVGKTVGVAPGADLYYIAETHVSDAWLQNPTGDMREGFDFTWTAKSIERILEVNRTLPRDRKIRVISISVGWSPEQLGYEAVSKAVKQATEEGVFVVSTALQSTHGLSFHALGRDPNTDPELPASYGESSWDRYYLDEHPGAAAPILVPMDSRTTASPTGARDYVFYRTGGWSWAVPYVAGLYALACQVKPDVTPEGFWKVAAETGDTITVEGKASAPFDEAATKSRLDAFIAQQKSNPKPGQPLEQALAEMYSKQTGEKKESMAEEEFRAWAVPFMKKQQEHAAGSHQLGKIVNPGRLVEGLRGGR